MGRLIDSVGQIRNLYIYEVEGKLEGFPSHWREQGFRGCWHEAGYSFLFFCAPRDRLVRDFLSRRPGTKMRSSLMIPYEDWEAGRPLVPFRVGPLWVVPPWTTVESKRGEEVIVVDPGVCFGSGFHPSTRGSLELLVGLCGRMRPSRVVDLGTGTGILALAAARLGAEHVLAVDLQPLAVETAFDNVRRNGLEGIVEVRLADAKEALLEPADLIVANLTYDLICSLLELDWVWDGRWCILSGVVGGQVRLLKEKLASLGFQLWEVRGENLWFTILASSPKLCRASL